MPPQIENHKKFPKWPMCLLAILGVLVGGYFLYQYLVTPQISNPDQFSDWKTYTNTEYGFELKYPNNWSNNPGPINDVFLFGPDEPNDRQFKVQVSTKSNLDQIIENKTKECSKATIDGGEAYRCEGAGTSYIYFEIKHLDKYYFISWLGPDFAKNSSIFDQILSTFKFIK
jgi:hypothetical protein